MPRNAGLRAEELCYDRSMKEVVSPDVAKQPSVSRKRRTKKHIVTPGTVEEISRGVGVTKRDKALVRKVLLELGYLKNEKTDKGNNGRSKTSRQKAKMEKS
jgi:hypothetical protein